MAPDTIERSPLTLKDPSLLRQRCYVDGQWLDADDRGSIPVIDPALNLPIGTAPVFHANETRLRPFPRGRAADRNWPRVESMAAPNHGVWAQGRVRASYFHAWFASNAAATAALFQ